MNRVKDTSSDDINNSYSGSYLIDTNLGYNNNNNNNNNLSLVFENEFKINTSLSGSQSAPTSLIRSSEHFSYPHYTPTLDYMQCLQSADDSFGSSCSSGMKISYPLTQDMMHSSPYMQSSVQSIDSYFSTSESIVKSDKVDENDNTMKEDSRRGRGRGRSGHNSSVRKRHLNNENSTDDNRKSNSNDTSSVGSLHGRGKHGKALARHPFIPSYMDPNNGPHLCVVCKHNASGFHYRVMACEGCKGFFRRTVQNNLIYTCKFNNKCEIQPHNRAQCQECRWRKCMDVGMAKDLVLSDEARRAKKELIAANRAKKMTNDIVSNKGSNEVRDPSSPANKDNMNRHISGEDQHIINKIKLAFEETNILKSEVSVNFEDHGNNHILQSVVDHHVTSLIIKCDIIDDSNIQSAKFNFSQQFNVLSIIVEPIMQRVISFAFMLPKFSELSTMDQIILLKNACFDIICLRNSINYDKQSQVLRLDTGFTVTKDLSILHKLVEPSYVFANRISFLNMDNIEISLMAALALLSCDRLGLQDIEKVENLQDDILRAIDCYMKQNSYDNTHRQSELYATILPELRSTTSWHTQIMINSAESIISNLLPSIKAIYHYHEMPPCSTFVESSKFLMLNSSNATMSSSSIPGNIISHCSGYNPYNPYLGHTMSQLYSGLENGQSTNLGGNLYINSMLPSSHLSVHSGQSSFTELLTESSDMKLESLLMVEPYQTQESSSLTSQANFTPVNSLLTQQTHDNIDPVFDFTNNLL